MSSMQEGPSLSDSGRDADKYRRLLLAIEHASDEITKFERSQHINIDRVLSHLLEDLTQALDAEQAFVALCRTAEEGQESWLELTAVHPAKELKGERLDYSKLLKGVCKTGNARVVDLSDEEPDRYVIGLERFQARHVILVRLLTGRQTRIIGVCNRTNPSLGAFLAADRRMLDNLLKLIAIGTRTGERRRREMEDIEQISAAISAELNLKELLPIVTRGAAHLFDTDTVSLILPDENRQYFTIKSSRGLSGAYIRAQRIPARLMYDRVMAHGMQTRVTRDLRHEADGDQDLIQQEGLYSVLSVPLVSSGVLTGILNIYSKHKVRDFSNDEKQLAEILANHASIAIRNAQLRKRELDGLLINSAVQMDFQDESKLLKWILGQVSQFFKVPTASILFWDSDRQHLLIKCTHKIASNNAIQIQTAMELLLRNSRRDHKSFKPFSVCNLINAQGEGYTPNPESSTLIAALVAPGQAETLGVLALHDPDASRTYTSEDRQMAAVLANQAAILIRSAQLNRENMEHGEQLAALENIALEIAGRRSPNELYQEVIERAVKLIKGVGGIIYLWDDKSEEITAAASYGLSLDLSHLPFEKDRGIISQVRHSKKSYWVGDYCNWPKRQYALDALGLKSVVGVPVLSGEQLVGLIVVHDNQRQKAFGAAEARLLERLASHVALAIENAQAYAAEHDAKEHLDRLVESSPDGIISIDNDGTIIQYNEGAAGICGYSFTEVVEQKMNVVTLYGNLESAKKINHLLKQQGKLENYETIVMSKSGQRIPIALSASIRKDKDGRDSGSVGFFKDLRPLRRTINAIQDVAKANDLKGGLDALAESMVRSLNVTFCNIMLATPNREQLTVRAFYPIPKITTSRLQWKPELGKSLNFNDFPHMRHLLDLSAPRKLSKDEIVDGIDVISFVEEMLQLNKPLDSLVIVPLKRDSETFGICILGETRQDRAPFTEEKIALAEVIANQVSILIYRMHSLESLRLREGLLEAGKEITASRDLPTILQSIADGVLHALECDIVTLYTYNKATDEIALPTVSGVLEHPEALEALGYVSRRSIVWKILASAEPYFAPNSTQDSMMILTEAERHPGVTPFVEREHIVSSAGIPLMIGNDPVGILFVNHRKLHNFVEQERKDIKIFADQAAMAIDKIRLLQESETQGKYLRALYDASKTIIGISPSNFHHALETLLESAVVSVARIEGVKATRGTIQLYEPTTNSLVFECAYPKSELQSLMHKIGERLSLDDNKGITVRAARIHQPQSVANVCIDPWYLEYDPTTRSELAVPILDGARLLGVLDIESDQLDAFDNRDISALTAFADMVASVLNSAEQGQLLNRTNTFAMAAAWGAELAHDVNREAGAIRRKIYRLLEEFPELSSESRIILKEIYRYVDTLMLPPLPKQPLKPGERFGSVNAAVLDDVIRSYVLTVRSQYPKVNFDLKLDCPHLKVSIHEYWLRRILRHLVRNGIMATTYKDPKSILLRTQAAEGKAIVEVQDSGMGIAPDIERILFKQPIPHSDGREGLGLLIVNFLAENHSGKAGIRWSRAGEGACFYFELPCFESKRT